MTISGEIVPGGTSTLALAVEPWTPLPDGAPVFTFPASAGTFTLEADGSWSIAAGTGPNYGGVKTGILQLDPTGAISVGYFYWVLTASSDPDIGTELKTYGYIKLGSGELDNSLLAKVECSIESMKGIQCDVDTTDTIHWKPFPDIVDLEMPTIYGSMLLSLTGDHTAAVQAHGPDNDVTMFGTDLVTFKAGFQVTGVVKTIDGVLETGMNVSGYVQLGKDESTIKPILSAKLTGLARIGGD